METEHIWNGIKPFKTIEKGSNGRINYGYYRRKGLEHMDKRNERRKIYRQIRKYGFDLSETWGLDYTIMRWLSDTYGGFFRQVGCSDDWSDYDENGVYYDYLVHGNNEKLISHLRDLEKQRYDSFKAHLKDFLDNATPEQKKEIADFCCPRLRALAKYLHGWPLSDDFKTFEDWKKEIHNMADQFEQGSYSPYFVTHFFSLWD